jgi:hypothetical protein
MGPHQGLSNVPFVTPTGAAGGAEGSGGNGSYRVHPPCGDSSAARAVRVAHALSAAEGVGMTQDS